MVQLIQQRQKDDCGVCVVAMAAEVSYEVALRAVFPDIQKGYVVRMTWKTYPTDLREALRRLGRITSSKITPIGHWDIRHEAIVAIGDYRSSDFHWVYHAESVVFDPSLDEVYPTDEYFYAPTGIIIIRPFTVVV